MTGPGTSGPDTAGGGTAAAAAAGPAGAGAHDRPLPDRVGAGRRVRPVAVLGLAFAGYLALSVLLWWGVWSTHPTSVTTCGCEDPSLFLWFLEWPAYALTHGLSPFYSTALFHPGGVNLLANTSVLAVGIPLAPVTWIWGPVATLDVASTLVPALSALAMCWLLLRWVRWWPAAVVGGLAYGFSPFVISNLAVSHLMTAMLALVPLVVGCLDELLVRQRRSPVAVGAALGVLLAVQFFVGTEVLVMVVVFGAVGVVLVAGYALVGRRHRAVLVAHAPHALRGLVVAAVVGGVLLAYPLWFALAGPAHFSGLVWPTLPPGSGGLDLSNLWGVQLTNPATMKFFAGYQGPPLVVPEYVGAGLLVVVGLGCLAWRRDRRLWCFGAVGVVAVVLSLGRQSYWTPWRVLAHVPVIQNVLPGRMMAVVVTCLAVMVGVVADRTYGSVRGAVLRLAGLAGAGEAGGTVSAGLDIGPAGRAAAPPRARRDGRRRARAAARARSIAGILGSLVGLGVAAVALVPMGTSLAGDVPLTVVPVPLPAWFAAAAHQPGPRQVVLTFPPPAVGGSTMAWQALARMPFDQATGSGPGSVVQRAGAERVGQEILTAAASLFPTLARPTPADVVAVRRAVAGWQVTEVVVPDPSALVPRVDRADSTAWALGIFTLALGRAPVWRSGAWVWTGVQAPGVRRMITRDRFLGCTSPAHYRRRSRLAVPDCVLAASRPAG